jgi:hypothetical protein
MTINARLLDTRDNMRVFGLIAGSAGVGKTTQLTTFPKDETIGISVEDGFLSIAGSGYKCLEVESYDEIMKILENPVYTKGIKYLYIDSLSEVYGLLKKDLSDKFKSAQNFAKHEEMSMKLFHLIRTARKRLDLNVFFTCHTKQEKNGMVMEENLAFDGKMPEDLKKQFDLILHMKSIKFDGQSEPTRCFVTNPDLGVAKARVSPWLGITIGDYEEANLYKLTQKLIGKGA